MPTDKLTDVAIRKAKPSDKPLRLFDGNGIYLEVQPNGAKWWRHKFRFGGREKLLSLGVYPEVTLVEARAKRAANRKLLESGVDPSMARKAAKAARADLASGSFEAVAREFLQQRVEQWSAPHARRWIERLEKDVFPWMGSLPIDSITPSVLLQTLRRVEARGVRETVHSIHQACGQVFRYGIATSRCERNPSSDLRGALKPVLVKHVSAITEPRAVGDLMRAIADYQGHPATRGALQLSALTFQRPGNIRAMRWADVDLDRAVWTIPAADMKQSRYGKQNGRPHIVPLARQAVAALRELEPLTNHRLYVFPSLQGQGRCMSENTVNVALRRLGFDKETMTAHGFRAMARTLLVEKLNAHPDVIEAQLAHGKSGPLGAAYDRAEFIEQRRTMMQVWADYLDQLRIGEKTSRTRAAKTRVRSETLATL